MVAGLSLYTLQMDYKKKAEEIFGLADISINGSNPWDIQIHNDAVYAKVFSGGSLTAGESYMDGDWDVEQLDEFFFRFMRTRMHTKINTIGILPYVLKARLLNRQSRSRAFEVGEKHYDLGNDLYQAMLDRRMVYSCAYWKDAKTLDEAQEHKLDLICRKIGLKAGDTVLDIGCGWGGFSKFAAERYGASVVGTTISTEQADLAREKTKGFNVEIRLQDWRDMKNESFKHIVSIGMFEHVGPKNYRAFMEKVNSLLSEDGLFLLHTITSGSQAARTYTDPWIDTYIFPNGVLPAQLQMDEAARGVFVTEDIHNFGAYYDRTLMEWWKNFDAAWPQLSKKYNQRFYRMWKYYLHYSAGFFRSRNIHLWQIVYSKKGVLGGYMSVR